MSSDKKNLQDRVTALLEEATDKDRDIHAIFHQVRVVHRCSNNTCGLMHKKEDLAKLDASKVLIQVKPGQPMPSGACPECANFCYPVNQVPDCNRCPFLIRVPSSQDQAFLIASALATLTGKVDTATNEMRKANSLEASRMAWNKDKQRLEALKVLRDLIDEGGLESLDLQAVSAKIKELRSKKGKKDG